MLTNQFRALFIKALVTSYEISIVILSTLDLSGLHTLYVTALVLDKACCILIGITKLWAR